MDYEKGVELMDLWNASVDRLIDTVKSEGLTRAYIVTDPHGVVRASTPALTSIAEAVANDDNYVSHEACFFEIGRESDHLLGAFVHRTKRGQAAGGVRFWGYESVRDYIRDGLRLSRGMGQKNALAGIWWGGGKGVIARRHSGHAVDHRDPQVRAAVYRDYGRFVSSLRGCYVSAEDAGTTPDDMVHVFETTRYTTCIPQEFGGSGNPSILTATGVVVAMEAALEHLGLGSLEGKTIALQGLGNVAFYMIEELLTRGAARIIGVDIDLAAIQAVGDRFPDDRLETRVVAEDDVSIFSQTCDVFAPNAVGATLNPRTIPLMKTKIVCGAANNQLEATPRDALGLQERDILYVPDFLANRMGIVNCANEQYGVFDGDVAIHAHLDRTTPSGVFKRCLDVCSRAATSGRTTAEEAEALADELSKHPHPLWGSSLPSDYRPSDQWRMGAIRNRTITSTTRHHASPDLSFGVSWRSSQPINLVFIDLAGNLAMKEHHLSVTRTARYITIGNSENPEQLWFVCHGYRQLASRFLRYFAALDDGRAYIVAPEALSRFYIGDDRGPHGLDALVGATWMTREDRLNEIRDYVAYLDALHDQVFEKIDRSSVVLRVLGFSQGVDTVCRWITQGRVRPQHVILWAGLVPMDVNLDQAKSPFQTAKLSVVLGDHDDVATPERVESLQARLASVDYDFVRFDGGHHLNKNVLSQLARVPVE